MDMSDLDAELIKWDGLSRVIEQLAGSRQRMFGLRRQNQRILTALKRARKVNLGVDQNGSTIQKSLKTCILARKMVPLAGLEPATPSLRMMCSTT
jgi:hypothetical protein